MSDLDIFIQPTPNPNALKFILDKPVKDNGSSTYRTPMECGNNELAVNLFTVRGVDQLHFFENVITITKFNYESWDEIEPKIMETINTFMPMHNSSYEEYDPEVDRRKNLSPELLAIEEILDRTIRPGLQGDGGDVQTLSYEDNVLLIKYQGACGTCPSSTTGTLEAMKAILRDEYNPDIDVYIAPEW
ncbi:NifU family protein [Bacteriovorax sp. Seq25_V]|uniref:NifU family protein n=1 Tax=Bacteriovorax sp. Seq25_V TaxID=1201288 RepID=UPI00038A3376|nr:NifU family protein [Bacteriovorax sp. Seq25_V]EQC46207.1 NifU-like protein [Bacteriovorax sp. Seq25_V]